MLTLRVLLFLAVALLPRLAVAQALPDFLKSLTDADAAPAIASLTQLDDPKAVAALRALAAGNLFRRLSDDAIVIAEKDGAMYVVTNAATGEVEDMATLDQIEVIAIGDEARKALAGAGAEAGKVEAKPLDFAGAVAALNAESFADKGKAIESLAALGDSRAMPVLEALAGGRLFVRKSDGIIVIGERSGNETRIAAAATQEPGGVVSPAALDPIFINNNLRNLVIEAVGKLGLSSADRAQRLRAADALVGNIAPAALTMLRAAFENEVDGRVKSALAMALASAELASEDRDRRLAAVASLSGATDLRVRGLLQSRMSAEADPEVKAAVAAALASVQNKLAIIDLAANLFQGISLGSVLLLAAIGLAITFGVMGVINMAHGEMIMIGAYATFVTQEVFRAYLPAAWFDLYLLYAIPVGFLATAIAGIAIERGVIRWLYGRPLETLLATWGISLILQQVVRSIFGSPNKEVANPAWMTGGFEAIGGFFVTWNRLYIILFCFMVLGLIAVILRRTTFGLQMRAVTQNRDMAAVMGIPTARVDALTFGLGSGIAGVAGVALSQIGNVSPNLGQIYIVDSFMVVVFGGVGNLVGTLVGAMSLGIINKFLEPFAGAVLGKIVVLVAIILFIQKRPRGLFALRGRSADA